ncbi:MAG: DUF3341 domain-containing protein [Bacteroidetes bacterium]|nr:hypothetical protein AWN76_010400 [Rhodothermaceae bacterium RA]RMH54831.1 MAG: DUF3341 domain-containing protein [Bacteroidota bacterium]
MNKLFQEILATMGIYRSNEDKVYGVLAEFAHPGDLLRAARETHRAGYRKFDTHSPFPIHGMDRAMGLGQSKLGFIVFFGGTVVGFALGVWLQWWTGGVDYPLNISGKPFFALEPSVPIIFELTILLSALTAVAGMLALNGLPRPYNPLFYSRRFMRATDDGFFLHIAASDSRFDLEAVQAFLKGLGALHVEVIEDREEADVAPEPEPAPAA